MQIELLRSPLITLTTYLWVREGPTVYGIRCHRGREDESSQDKRLSFIVYQDPLFLRQDAPGRRPEPYLSHWGNSAAGYDTSLTSWEQNLLEMGGILTF